MEDNKSNHSNEELLQKTKHLEKQLEWEKIRNTALDTMISIAEQISIFRLETSLTPTGNYCKKFIQKVSIQQLCSLLSYFAQAYHKQNRMAANQQLQ